MSRAFCVFLLLGYLVLVHCSSQGVNVVIRSDASRDNYEQEPRFILAVRGAWAVVTAWQHAFSPSLHFSEALL